MMSTAGQSAHHCVEHALENTKRGTSLKRNRSTGPRITELVSHQTLENFPGRSISSVAETKEAMQVVWEFQKQFSRDDLPAQSRAFYHI